MSRIDEFFNQARKTSLEVHHQLEVVESGSNTSTEFQNALSATINNFLRMCQTLDSMLLEEHPSRRDMWKKKVNQLTDDATSCRQSLDRVMYRNHQKMTEQQERESLMAGRRKRAENSVAIDILVHENQSLLRSKRVVEDMFSQGANTLLQLSQQRERLKNAQRRLFDVMNTLGLSNVVLRAIERRHYVDRWIVYVGMLVTLAVLYFLWYYVRTPRS